MKKNQKNVRKNCLGWKKHFGFGDYYQGTTVKNRQRYSFPDGTIIEVEKNLIGYTVYEAPPSNVFQIILGSGSARLVKDWLARAEDGWFDL